MNGLEYTTQLEQSKCDHLYGIETPLMKAPNILSALHDHLFLGFDYCPRCGKRLTEVKTGGVQ